MKKFVILIPVYDDWESVLQLLERIDEHADLAHVSVMIVNDGSTNKNLFSKEKNVISVRVDHSPSKHLEKDYQKIVTDQFISPKIKLKNIQSFKIIHMKENRGHTRCIAAGLKYISENEKFDFVIPMDGDGEDRPEELYLFFKESEKNPREIIIGNRIKRSEGFIFKFCYIIHRFLTLIYIGNSMKFGNYVCLPKEKVEKLLKEKALWCSFSGTVHKLDGPNHLSSIPSIRGKRFQGPSKMNFFNLIKHSLSIFAVQKRIVFCLFTIYAIISGFFVYEFYQSYYLTLSIVKIISLEVRLVLIIPLILFLLNLIFFLLVLLCSKRSSLDELNASLNNIEDIEELK